MIHPVAQRLNQFATDYPGTFFSLAIGGMSGCAIGLRNLLRSEAAERRRREEAAQRETQAPPRPPFGHGAFLEGLSALAPTMEVSTCEWLSGFVGFEVPERRQGDRNFAQLLNACRDLPATVENAPWLQKQIDALRERIETLSLSRYPVPERGEGVDAIVDLWGEVLQLRSRLKAERARQMREALQQGPSPGGCWPRFAPPPTRPGADADGDADADAYDDGSAQRLFQQTIKRRHRTTGEVDAAAPPPPLAPAVAAPFRLQPEQRQQLREAIAYAWARRDGSGRLTHKEERRLGAAIAGAIGGTYPTHLGHGGPQERRYDIDHVLKNATEFMTPWHRDAVRGFGAHCLRALQRS